MGAVLVTACTVHESGLALVAGAGDGGRVTPPTAGGSGNGFEGQTVGTGRAPDGAAAPDAPPPDSGTNGTSAPDALPVDAMMVAPPAPDAAAPAPVVQPPPPPPDAGPMIPPATPGSVACGASACGARQICCSSLGGSACVPENGLCLGAARRCDGPEDCAGEGKGGEGGGVDDDEFPESEADSDRVCCARPELVGGFRSQCQKAKDCMKGGGSILCRAIDDCQRMQMSCAPAGFGVMTCQR